MKPEDVTPEMVAEKVLGWTRLDSDGHDIKWAKTMGPLRGGAAWLTKDCQPRAPDFTQPGPAMELLEAMRATLEPYPDGRYLARYYSPKRDHFHALGLNAREAILALAKQLAAREQSDET